VFFFWVKYAAAFSYHRFRTARLAEGFALVKHDGGFTTFRRVICLIGRCPAEILTAVLALLLIREAL